MTTTSSRRSSPVLAPPTPAALRRLRVEAPDGFVDAVMDQLGLHGADRFVTVTSAAGDLFVTFNDAGISAVVPAALYDDDPAQFALAHRRETGRPLVASAARAPAGLMAALRTGRATRLRYDLAGLTPFERAVLMKTLEIPSGEVRPYGWVAREIGRPRAVRAVGSALGRNPVPVLIPCHRVVRSDGQLGNYGLGVPMKRTLLSAEGVDIERLERLADAGVRFVGSDTTHVFCVPSCVHARGIKSAHEVRFRTATAARDAGYRACAHSRAGVDAATRRSRRSGRGPRLVEPPTGGAVARDGPADHRRGPGRRARPSGRGPVEQLVPEERPSPGHGPAHERVREHLSHHRRPPGVPHQSGVRRRRHAVVAEMVRRHRGPMARRRRRRAVEHGLRRGAPARHGMGDALALQGVHEPGGVADEEHPTRRRSGAHHAHLQPAAEPVELRCAPPRRAQAQVPEVVEEGGQEPDGPHPGAPVREGADTETGVDATVGPGEEPAVAGEDSSPFGLPQHDVREGGGGFDVHRARRTPTGRDGDPRGRPRRPRHWRPRQRR